jgi:hypothetical protein
LSPRCPRRLRHAYGHRHTLAVIRHRVQFQDLVRKLLERVDALLVRRAGMRRPPRDPHFKPTPSATLGFDSSRRCRRRFEAQCRGARTCKLFDDSARGRAADFLIGVQQVHDRSARRTAELLEQPEGKSRKRNTGLHIENTGPVRLSSVNAIRPIVQRPSGPDGIHVTKNQDRAAVSCERTASKCVVCRATISYGLPASDNTIAIGRARDNLNTAAKNRQLLLQKGG